VASSAANAARSEAEAKRASLSIPSVASGLPAPPPGRCAPDFADEAPGDAEQPARRALIGRAAGIGRHRRQRGRRDDVCRGGRLHDALDR
jgi:hypothetical protein